MPVSTKMTFLVAKPASEEILGLTLSASYTLNSVGIQVTLLVHRRRQYSPRFEGFVPK